MHSVDLVNLALAIAGVLIALGAINRMSRQTECTIILSFATVAAGLTGYALGSLMPDAWQRACDTLWLGGVAALLAGSRRQTIWLAPQWMPKISLGISVVTWLFFFWEVA
jgi:hypothetical protein